MEISLHHRIILRMYHIINTYPLSVLHQNVSMFIIYFFLLQCIYTVMYSLCFGCHDNCFCALQSVTHVKKVWSSPQSPATPRWFGETPTNEAEVCRFQSVFSTPAIVLPFSPHCLSEASTSQVAVYLIVVHMQQYFYVNKCIFLSHEICLW